jgi:hypothetical protein
MDKGIDPDIFVEKIKLGKKEELTEEKAEEEEKSKIFKKIKDKDKVKKDKDKAPADESKALKEEEEKLKYDNQVQAAVNVLKGMRIFEQYQQVPAPAEVEPVGQQ